MKDHSRPITASLGFGIHPKTKASGARDRGAPGTSHKPRILVVDSDPAMRRLMGLRLDDGDYSVEIVTNAPEALDACVRRRPNLVITGLRLEGMNGLALLKELKGRWPDVTVIILTAYGTIPAAVQATQDGAFGFLVKPVDKSELLGQVKRAIAASTFTSSGGDWRAEIVSRSKLMEDRLGQANWAAGGDSPVLLTGENGTGKELLARAIHAASARRDKPFVAVNCRIHVDSEPEVQDGVPDQLGTELSAAIGAARGGTVLLNDIGDLSLSLQEKLSAVLRNNSIQDDRGGANVRLICTSSCDLKELMNTGKLRQELYYQINILPIEMPPLGRRREDIPLLVSHFLEQATEQSGTEKIYSPEAIELLATSDWPGNVRQLFDLVKQNVALAQGTVMTEAFVQESLGNDAARTPTYDEARDQFSRDYLTDNLQQTKGNISKSARLAKRSRTDFYKLLARFRIHPDDFKDARAQGSVHSKDSKAAKSRAV